MEGMKSTLQQNWDLDSIFPGGSGSAEFRTFLDQLKQDIESFSQAFGEWSRQPSSALVPATEKLQSISARLGEAESFTECLASQNMEDRQAAVLTSAVKTLRASFEASLSRYNRLLAEIPDDEWNRKIEQEDSLRTIRFNLEERREQAKDMLPPEQEALIQDLGVDGYHGWAEMYNTIVNRIRIPFEGRELSAGQAANKLHHPDANVRREMFAKWEQAWADHEDLFSAVLNRIAGFRLQVYRYRGWDSVLKEPLRYNRMSRETLDSMWQAIEEAKPVLVEYLQRKAKLLGLDRLSWADVEAPLGNERASISYDEAADIIVQQFAGFSPRMADFAEQAFRNRWIEAADRPGKRPGGFCTSFPVSKQSRIFMTYAGTSSNVSTIAHELGHAYHQAVLDGLPELAQHYAMNVAETASTFAEWILSDAMVRSAKDDKERLLLLDDKVQNVVSFFMNIHARFLFEVRFYEERRAGMVPAERLNELMLDAQRRAYRDALSEYHPRFWASKLHFYLTDVPFYNFPYSFGYLFSAGLYARAVREGAAFEQRYVDLLRDTGRMTVEQLAAKHLGVDLTKPGFWQEAVNTAVQDVRQFLKLSEESA